MPNHPVRVVRWQATVILTLFFTAVAGAAAIGWWYARDSSPHQGPIVLIAVDGLPQAAVGRAENPSVIPTAAAEGSSTAALDALAADSVIFERAYAHSPQLVPSSASLLAGQLPFDHGVRDEGGFTLPDEVRTLPELLRNRGFLTGAAIASPALGVTPGLAQGFSFFEAPGGVDPLAALDGSPTGDGDGTTALDAAEAWARAQENGRYFLYLQVNADEADAAVGRVVEMLQERDSYDRSTIVFVGSRGRAGADARLDEETLLVPLLVKQPYRENAGLRVDTLVQHIDLLPTMLDLVRAPIPGGMEGRSLRPLLTDRGGRITPEPVYAETLAAHYRFGGTPEHVVTVNDVRYVRGPAESLIQLGAGEPDASLASARRISDEEAPADDDATPLSAAMDRLLGTSQIAPGVEARPADREELARAGFVPGLRRVGTPAPHADGLTAAEQQALLESHQAAARLLGARDYTAALRSFRALARTYPSVADLHYQIACVALQTGQLQEALASLSEAAGLAPDSPQVFTLRATALLKAGRVNDARSAADRAIALATEYDPGMLPDSHDIAARAALAAHDPDAALGHAAAVEEARPGVPMRAYVEGMLLLDAGDTDAGVRLLEDAARKSHEIGAIVEDLHLSLAAALSSVDRRAEAEAAYREEIRAFPGAVVAYTALARLYAAADRQADASLVLETLLERVPTPEAYAAAARTWTAIGGRTRADVVRSEARARFPGDRRQVPAASGRAR